MGIFAKRAISKDEELTFNYNVDRYGFVELSSHYTQANGIRLVGMRRSDAFVGSRIAWGTLVARLRLI